MGSSQALDFDHAELINAIDDSRERLHFEIRRLQNLRQFSYPTVSNANRGETSLNILAPTRMGNLTRTMRSYALDRYGIDLDIFWTKLQRTLQKESNFYQTLSDAKIQVDFLVSLTFLTMMFTAFCVLYLRTALHGSVPRHFDTRTCSDPSSVPGDLPKLPCFCRSYP